MSNLKKALEIILESNNQIPFSEEQTTFTGDTIQKLYSTDLKKNQDLKSYNVNNLWRTYIITKTGKEHLKYIVFNKKLLILKDENNKMTARSIDEEGRTISTVKEEIDDLSDINKKFSNTQIYDLKEVESKDFNLVFGETEIEQNKLIKDLNLISFKKYDFHIVNYVGRYIVLKEVKGHIIPFYLSSGQAGKENVPVGKWYAIGGVSPDGWIVKMGQNREKENIIVQNFYIKSLQDAAKQLNDKIGNITLIENKIKNSVIFLDKINSIFDDVNQSFKTKIKNKESFDEILLRILELYKILGAKEKDAILNLINSLHYDSGSSMDSIKRKFDRIGIDILPLLNTGLKQFKKDLSNINGDNQNIDAIVKALLYVKNEKATDFEVYFKKESKEESKIVILKVENEKYTINNDKNEDDFNFNLDTLRDIATLIISHFKKKYNNS
jgi:hypothetical protein